MDPVVVRAKGGEGWVIYLLPPRHVLDVRLAKTHGEQWDPIERKVLVGGIPGPLARVPHVFATKADAIASLLKRAA